MTSNLVAQKQSGNAFQENRHMLEALFESVPEAVVISDETGCIVRVNIQVERLFGYSRDELRGQPIEILLPGQFRQPHLGLGHHQDPQRGALGMGLEQCGRHKDGKEFLIDVMSSLLETGQGKLLLSLIRDVSERDPGLASAAGPTAASPPTSSARRPRASKPPSPAPVKPSTPASTVTTNTSAITKPS